MALAALPGMPKLPFLLLVSAPALRVGTCAEGTGGAGRRPLRTPANQPHPGRQCGIALRVEPLAIEVGLGLIGLVEGAQDSPLLRRISAIRRQLAGDLGYLLAPVRFTDNLALRSREYVISLKGVEVSRYELPQGCELAIPTSTASGPIDGQATARSGVRHERFLDSLRACRTARQTGYTVVDSVSVLGTYLSELIRRYAHELFSRQDAKRLLDRVLWRHPKVVEDVVPSCFPLYRAARAAEPLRERVSIRDAVSILEALGEAGGSTRNPVLLTEYVRQSIRRAVVKPYLNRAGDLHAWFIDPALEHAVESAVEHGEQNSHLPFPPQQIREVLNRISARIQSPEMPVVAITSSGARYFLRQIGEPTLPNLFFLAHNEVPPGLRVQSLGNIQ